MCQKFVFTVIIALHLSSYLSNTSHAATYYVDKNHTQANDNNPGTITQPWLTIHKANQTLMPGDTVLIRSGTYYIGNPIGNTGASNEKQGICPINTGTVNNRIVYSNYNNETVNFIGDDELAFAVDLNSDYTVVRSYITVHGLNFSNCNKFMWILKGCHNEISHCKFQRNYPRSDGQIEWRGSTIYRNAKYNHIHDCIFSDYGKFNAQDDKGVVFELGNESTDNDSTSYNLIENNQFFHGGHHVMGVAGRFNVIRNNYFHNENWWEDSQGNKWGNRILYFNGPSGINRFNLFEGNRVAFGGETVEPDQIGGAGMGLYIPYNIVRKNIFHHTLIMAIHIRIYIFGDEIGKSNNNHIYNNNFYHNGYSTTTKPNMDNEYTHAIRFNLNDDDENTYNHIYNNHIKNNIFYGNRNKLCDTLPIVRRGQFWAHWPLLNQVIENNWNEKGDPLFRCDLSSLNPNTQNPDFRLNQQSPCIDIGGFLTKITSENGSGNTFVVEDAGYFMDGWGIIEGDEIQLEGSFQRVKIDHINYDNNSITVNKSINWTKGIGVSLIYEGSAPDIGAYEYKETSNITNKQIVANTSPGLTILWNGFAVQYHIPISSLVYLDVYNLSGRFIQRLVDDNNHPSGTYMIQSSQIQSLANGMYLLRLTSDCTTQRTKAVVIKRI